MNTLSVFREFGSVYTESNVWFRLTQRLDLSEFDSEFKSDFDFYFDSEVASNVAAFRIDWMAKLLNSRHF